VHIMEVITHCLLLKLHIEFTSKFDCCNYLIIKL
jgi:hypothetical protein